MKTTFFVPGIPATKGSTRSFRHRQTGKIITRADNAAKLESWEARVALAAKAAGLRPHAGAVAVNAEFSFPRPKSHYTRAGRLRGAAPADHTQKPDLDKLLRAVLDGLTGIAYRDDAQVSAALPMKAWAEAEAGARIVVTFLGGEP